MHQEYHRWHSSRVGHQMGVVVYGHFGAPILAFPTSGGDEWEHEGQGMIGTLAPFIEAGKIKVFTVGAVTAESFYNANAHPFHRSWMQSQYRRLHPAGSDPLHPHPLPGRGGGDDDGRVAGGVSRGEYAAETS